MEDVYPLRQVVFEHQLLERPHAVPIDDRMRGNPEFLLELLREWGLDRGRPVRAFATDEEIPWVSGVLQKRGYPIPANWAATTFPAQKIALVAAEDVSRLNWDGSRVCRHQELYLGWWRCSPIRKQRSDQFVKNFKQQRPTKWMHILAVERVAGTILAHAQFFAGPGILPLPYVIRIGRDPARIMRYKESRAHQFVILDPVARAGEMLDADPVRLIWTP